MKIRAAVKGITTITAPQTRLQRKFAKVGVIKIEPFAFDRRLLTILIGFVYFFINLMAIRRSHFILFSWFDWAIAVFPPVEQLRAEEFV